MAAQVNYNSIDLPSTPEPIHYNIDVPKKADVTDNTITTSQTALKDEASENARRYRKSNPITQKVMLALGVIGVVCAVVCVVYRDQFQHEAKTYGVALNVVDAGSTSGYYKTSYSRESLSRWNKKYRGHSEYSWIEPQVTVNGKYYHIFDTDNGRYKGLNLYECTSMVCLYGYKVQSGQYAVQRKIDDFLNGKLRSSSYTSYSYSYSSSSSLPKTHDDCKYRDLYSKQMRSKSECSAKTGCEWDLSLPGGGACQKRNTCMYKPGTKNKRSKSECSAAPGCSWNYSYSGGGACDERYSLYGGASSGSWFGSNYFMSPTSNAVQGSVSVNADTSMLNRSIVDADTSVVVDSDMAVDTESNAVCVRWIISLSTLAVVGAVTAAVWGGVYGCSCGRSDGINGAAVHPEIGGDSVLEVHD